MKIKAIILCLLLLVVLIFSSCATEKILVTQTVSQTQTQTVTHVRTITLQPTVTPIIPTTTIQPQKEYEVVNAEYKVTYKHPVYWEFSWQATIKNNTSEQIYLVMRAIFVDKDGFLLGSSMPNLVSLDPKEEKTIKDSTTQILADKAPNVVRMEVEIE